MTSCRPDAPPAADSDADGAGVLSGKLEPAGRYAPRNRIERFFNLAKNSRRVATRNDKLIESFAAFVLLASIRIWIKFVHAT
jgi:transposase